LLAAERREIEQALSHRCHPDDGDDAQAGSGGGTWPRTSTWTNSTRDWLKSLVIVLPRSNVPSCASPPARTVFQSRAASGSGQAPRGTSDRRDRGGRTVEERALAEVAAAAANRFVAIAGPRLAGREKSSRRPDWPAR
jgi:hypothetical protein